MVGDGTKKSKEGKRMPGVKRLHQESKDSSKSSYIFRHMFAMIGVLAGDIGKLFCIPLSIRIYNGDKEIIKWDAEPEEVKTAGCELISIVVRAKRNAPAYEKPVRKPGRGRPPIKGESVKLLYLWGAKRMLAFKQRL